MKLLTLVRHAKSSWHDHDCSDHDRPLNQRGRRDAPLMAQRLQNHGALPDKIYCSSAKRTRETCDIFLNVWQMQQECVEYEEALYLASTGTLQGIIERASDDIDHLLLIAHNPGLEQLSMLLHPEAPKTLPTCAMVQFQLNQSSFSATDINSISLEWYEFPKSAT